MTAREHIDGIPEAWVEEFPVDVFVDPQAGTPEWLRLHDVLYNHPRAALRLFERFAEEHAGLPFEQLSVGPLQTFLMVHGDERRDELEAISSRNAVFAQAYAAAQAAS